ncbi:MAG: TetR/AcrR family transcriptional regulator [Alphaproteobacteria bacterium]|nr:TetR/AcrR family transcriptional regulator [Alphaproteobacteria bacterium]MCB9672915.1 TetR/AcrR family transcriptional regulator [Alphaproteobacteria bacterium]MCB9692171.1 TetR/AcrR family transcriptional regulator [Alphaproteobacteria bacterium]MCB9694766.1 TetR/AcrR family transcriptional regulator [Alphaproteobacteria bacterium]
MADDEKTGNPRGARSIKRILDAAARIFGREGFQGASMSAVARAAGVSKGLLHYHFDSKEHLLIEAQRATFRQIHSRFEERHQAGQRGMDGALEVLDNLWEALREMRTWAPFMVEILALGAHRGPIKTYLEEFVGESMELLEKGIGTVFADDLAAMEVSPGRLARLVRVSMYGLIVELAYARDEDALLAVDQTYADLRDTFAVIAVQRG